MYYTIYLIFIVVALRILCEAPWSTFLLKRYISTYYYYYYTCTTTTTTTTTTNNNNNNNNYNNNFDQMKSSTFQ